MGSAVEYYFFSDNETTLDNLTDLDVNDQNVDIEAEPCYSSAEYGALVVFICFILMLTTVCIIGNCLVIIVISRERRLKHPLNFFIINLAFSDLTIGLTYSIYNISHLEIDGINQSLGKSLSKQHKCPSYIMYVLFRCVGVLFDQCHHSDK